MRGFPKPFLWDWETGFLLTTLKLILGSYFAVPGALFCWLLFIRVDLFEFRLFFEFILYHETYYTLSSIFKWPIPSKKKLFDIFHSFAIYYISWKVNISQLSFSYECSFALKICFTRRFETEISSSWPAIFTAKSYIWSYPVFLAMDKTTLGSILVKLGSICFALFESGRFIGWLCHIYV